MSESKKDALTLVNAAIETLEKTPWKTRQDQRAANKTYTYLLAAQKALESELPPKEEPKDGSKQRYDRQIEKLFS